MRTVDTKGIGFAEPLLPQTSSDVDAEIYDSWVQYLTATLGRSAEFSHERAMADVTRNSARKLAESLFECGMCRAGARVLDVGSGHGTLAIELAMRGAKVVAAEPGNAWRQVAQRRIDSLGLDIEQVDACAESLPFEDGEFDCCVSLQVLEHVSSPSRAIGELSRVLRTDGAFYVSCENYLAFREQHYGVPWLPLLPKMIGSAYLSMLGRDPAFLREHVTYTTWPRLARMFLDAGLYDRNWEYIFANNLSEWKGRGRHIVKLLAVPLGQSRAQRAYFLMVHLRRMFGVGFIATGWKRGR